MTEYIQILQKKLPVVLMISALAAVATYAVAANIKPTHEVYFSYTVALQEREDAGEYRFDGFYALQATDLFAATLARWLTTPEFAARSYEKVGLPLPSENSRQLTKSIKAEKAAPQLVTVRVEHTSASAARKLAEAVEAVAEEQVKQYHDQGIPAVRFSAVASQPWAGVKNINVPVIVIAVLVFTFFIGINIVLLKESIKKP